MLFVELSLAFPRSPKKVFVGHCLWQHVYWKVLLINCSYLEASIFHLTMRTDLIIYIQTDSQHLWGLQAALLMECRIILPSTQGVNRVLEIQDILSHSEEKKTLQSFKTYKRCCIFLYNIIYLNYKHNSRV